MTDFSNIDFLPLLQRLGNSGPAASRIGFTGIAAQEGANRQADLIGSFLNFQVPEEQINQQLNVLNQGVAAGQNRANQQIAASNASRTGGRVSTGRAVNDVGGQAALAQQQGQAAIFQQAAQQESQMRLAGLQAYISKYGIDRNAELALQQMRNQQNAMFGQGLGSLLGLGAMFLPGPSGSMVNPG